MNLKGIEDTRREISTLSMMDHPNIIKYVESYEDSRYMYVVQEFVEESQSLQDVLTHS